MFFCDTARLSGKELEDAEEMKHILEGEAKSFRERIVQKSLQLLQRMGFFGILMFASVRIQCVV